LLGLLLLVAIAGVGVRLSMWAYEEYYIPRRTIPWIAYSPGIVEQLRAEGNIVLVHFTADWSFTVKWIETTVLETPDVRRAIYRNSVTPVLVDVSAPGPGSSYLQKISRATGVAYVPATLIFPADRTLKPAVFVDFCTQQEIIQALDVAAKARAAARRNVSLNAARIQGADAPRSPGVDAPALR
jgi:thiol:disulfide interchange protein